MQLHLVNRNAFLLFECPGLHSSPLDLHTISFLPTGATSVVTVNTQAFRRITKVRDSWVDSRNIVVIATYETVMCLNTTQGFVCVFPSKHKLLRGTIQEEKPTAVTVTCH